jgi:1,4-dihydroxy-2-naphthoate octaprenyltransferase
MAWRLGAFQPLRFALALAGSLLVQAAVNFIDEYSDHDRPGGALKHLAPYKVIARGELTPAALRMGTAVALGLATLVGLYLVAVTHWSLLVVCLLSLAATYFYAGGPRPLGHLGLGWILVFLFMGLVMVAASVFIHTERWSWEDVRLALPVACLVTAILVVNDVRDLEEDRADGKTTPVVLWGRPFGRLAWTGLVVAAFAVVLLGGAVRLPWPQRALVLVALPLALAAARGVWGARDRARLTRALGLTARLHFLFGLALAAAMVA